MEGAIDQWLIHVHVVLLFGVECLVHRAGVDMLGDGIQVSRGGKVPARCWVPALAALAVAIVAVAVAGCYGGAAPPVATAPPPSATAGSSVSAPLRYVALGDSYTIGTSVQAAESWPTQLAAKLSGPPARIELVANLGVNGYTSGDVVARELPRLDGLAPDFATLLIGVNDVVQGVPEATYRRNLGLIFDALLARLPASRLLVVTTPDYTVTPSGADYGDPATQRAAIEKNNSIITEVAAAHGIAVVDIFDISERAATDRSLVAKDGLHPSGEQYRQWVERIAPEVGLLIGP